MERLKLTSFPNPLTRTAISPGQVVTHMVPKEAYHIVKHCASKEYVRNHIF